MSQKTLGWSEIIIGTILEFVPGGQGLGTKLIIMGALTLAAAALAPDTPQPQQAALKGIIRSSVAAHQLVYGEVKTGGVLVFADTYGTSNEYLCVGVAHSVAGANGIESLGDAYVDNVRIPVASIDGSGNVTAGQFAGVVTIANHLGTSTQAADTLLINNFNYWGSTAQLKGIAYSVFRYYRNPNDAVFQTAFKNGIPQDVARIVRGQKVYDPRLDSTAGGTGAHRKNDSSTWTWSTNPALCLRDFMARAKLDGGCEYDYNSILDADLAAAANICDEMISVPTDGVGGSTSMTRYSCNIAILTGGEQDDSWRQKGISDLLACMAGQLVEQGGKFRIYAGAFIPADAAIDATWLRGGVQTTATAQRDDRWNAVRATFEDPQSDYQTIQCAAQASSAYQTADGGVQLWRELNVPGCNNQYQAQYLSHIALNTSRHQRAVSLACNLKALALESMEGVTLALNDEPGYAGKTFRVVQWLLNADFSVDIGLLEVVSTTWDSALGNFTYVPPATNAPVLAEIPPVPTGLTAVGTADGINLTWSPPAATIYSTIDIWRAPDVSGSPGTFSFLNTVRGGVYQDAVLTGATYWYKIRALNFRTTPSAYTAPVSATAKTVYSQAQIDAQLAAYVQTVTYNGGIAGLQSQIDGQVDSFFYLYDPTTANVPASDWNTTTLKDQHLNDTFTNVWDGVSGGGSGTAGASWRWVVNAGVYSWQLIGDTATQQALLLAGQAQDTADSKRRVFVAQPTTPYDVGDLWVNGNSIYNATVARASGAFVLADWTLRADKTSDNTANDTTKVNGMPAPALSPMATQTNVALNRLIVANTNGAVVGRGPFAPVQDSGGNFNYFGVPTASLPSSITVDLGQTTNQLSTLLLSSFFPTDLRVVPSAGTVDGSTDNTTWTNGIGSWSNAGTDPIVVAITGNYQYLRINLTGAPLAPGGQTITQISNCRVYALQSNPVHHLDFDVIEGTTFNRPRASAMQGGYIKKVSQDGTNLYPAKGTGDSQRLNLDNEIIEAGTPVYRRVGSGYSDPSGRIVTVWDDVTGVPRTGGYVGEGARRAQGALDGTFTFTPGLDKVPETASGLYARQPKNSAADNLADNGDFEDWLGALASGWQNNGMGTGTVGATMSRDTSPYSGTYCAKVSVAAGTGYTGISALKYFPVTPGQFISVGLALKSDGTNAVNGGAWCSDSTGAFKGTVFVPATSSAAWVYQTVQGLVPAGATRMYLAATGPNPPSGAFSYWVDAFSASLGSQTLITPGGAILGDGGNVPATTQAGQNYMLSGCALSDTGTTSKTISMASGTLYYGTTGSLSLGASSVTGLAPSTKYYCYVDLPSWTGGTYQLVCTTDGTQISRSPMRVFIGWIMTQAAGGGGGGGGQGCLHPSVKMLTRVGLMYADDLSVGDELLTPDGHWTPITALTREPCSEWLDVATGTGIARVTLTQPYRMADGGWTRAQQLHVGEALAHGLRVLSVTPVAEPSEKIILTIAKPHAFMLTALGPEIHNGTVKP